MPTASTAGMLSLNNLGALTTTFTAPSSCATSGVFRSGIANLGLDVQQLYRVGCGDFAEFPSECWPNGEELASITTSLEGRERGTNLFYHSPGLYCPDDWQTVGVYAPDHHSNDSTTTSYDLGIFSPTAFHNGRPGESTSFPYADFFANMFTSALAPTETAIVCCPQGFRADPYQGCYSHFPVTSLAGETGCIQSVLGGAISQDRRPYTYDFWGDSTTVTAFHGIVYATESASVSTITITFGDSGIPDIVQQPTGTPTVEYVGVAIADPIYLVNSGESPSGDGEGGDDDDGTGDGDAENGDDENGDDESAAHRFSAGADWRPIVGVLGAWAVSVAAGLGLLAAW